MKILLAVLALSLAGCQSLGTSGIDPAVAAAFLRPATAGSAYFALKNNPKYQAAASALIPAIDVALTGSALINAASIQAFVQQVAAKSNIDPVAASFFGELAVSAYDAYAAKNKITTGVLITDPNAKLFVQAFRDGLADAVAMLASAPPK